MDNLVRERNSYKCDDLPSLLIVYEFSGRKS